MHRYGIEDEIWFEAARTALERRGFGLRVQPRSIVIEKEQRLPRIVSNAREFLEFVERQGVRVEAAAFAAADRYGNDTSDLGGRATPSPFETPAGPGGGAVFGSVSEAGDVPQQGGAAPGVAFGRAGLAEMRAAQAAAAGDAQRLEQERAAAGARAALGGAQAPAAGLSPAALHDARATTRALEVHCARLSQRAAELEADLAQAVRTHAEAVAQRDLYQMSLRAAEGRLQALQAEIAGGERGPDRKFDQLRRFLARELHPDLAGEDAGERVLREAIFKRVWAKIEQLQ